MMYKRDPIVYKFRIFLATLCKRVIDTILLEILQGREKKKCVLFSTSWGWRKINSNLKPKEFCQFPDAQTWGWNGWVERKKYSAVTLKY